jgi:hypothetical protein
MHQGWPKFIQNLWYATADNGIAALLYGPSEVKAIVAEGIEVHWLERTNYPFNNEIEFEYQTQESVRFPLHLRIPHWCLNAEITINGQDTEFGVDNNIAVINREWQKGDLVKLVLPMEVLTSRWVQSSVGFERGPLVYAMPIKSKQVEQQSPDFPYSWYEYLPMEDWNYGISEDVLNKAEYSVLKNETSLIQPWNESNSPLKLKVKLKKALYWAEYNHSAGAIPCNVEYALSNGVSEGEEIDVELIPYGCTTLRIAQFPVLKEHDK